MVYLNGGADWQVPNDPRVVVERTSKSFGVGRAKQEAVELCSGEILIELDHDDLLMPTAIEKTVRAFEENPDAVFVYSDFQQVKEDGTPDSRPFNEAFGWRYDGERIISFLPTPSAVSYIWYGPNHIRAFTRTAYDAIGGYDEKMFVLDDQDLYCRLYQIGNFVHIPEMLYKQRSHAENTQSESSLNSQIQKETVELYDRYVEGNALAWAKRSDLLSLDLGGAHNSPDGYLSVDQHEPADLVGDIFEVLGNLADNSVGVIRAVDFMEHIPDKIGLMNELYRVLAHGGMLLSLTPSTDGRGAFQDPTHVSYWNENSFWYYTDHQYAKYVPEIICRFQVSRLVSLFPSDWHRENSIPYVRANLVAVKNGPRLPGLLNWPTDEESSATTR